MPLGAPAGAALCGLLARERFSVVSCDGLSSPVIDTINSSLATLPGGGNNALSAVVTGISSALRIVLSARYIVSAVTSVLIKAGAHNPRRVSTVAPTPYALTIVLDG